jgi:hypothetical protein
VTGKVQMVRSLVRQPLRATTRSEHAQLRQPRIEALVRERLLQRVELDVGGGHQQQRQKQDFLNRFVHLAHDRGKSRIRAKAAVLWKVARVEQEGRLVFVPGTSSECHRLFTLPGSLGRKDKIR